MKKIKIFNVEMNIIFFIIILMVTGLFTFGFDYLSYCYLTPISVSGSVEEYFEWYDEFQTKGNNGICDNNENPLISTDCRSDLIGDYYRDKICKR